MGYWACALTALGWIYVLLARHWPRIFASEAVRHAEADPSGYRVGRMVHWRLPGKAAALILALSAIPWLTVLFGFDAALPAVSLATALLVTWLWLGAPPGSRLSTVASAEEDGRSAFEDVATGRSLLRALLLMAVFGVTPALAIGWLLNQVIS